MPRDRRGLKGAAISSIFWLSVLFIKFIVDYAGLASVTPSVYHIYTVTEALEVNTLASLCHYVTLWLALFYRVIFAVIFFVANLQAQP